ncbi:hypothetical protein [Idiomarina ramblicola]|uniref:Uncharacterized protein n=1 Tax=Idiomarina ramblicola TaxID=263724 RepID=A0A432Z1Q0_9GAMM|nr:hypothetical protein [Idiomarina ramblicola]RUO71769.1 hypothetical protein CWI78_04435 [Idiomarina ramblicola]
MSHFEPIKRHYEQSCDLQQSIRQQDDEFSEQLETLNARWNDNAGQAFYPRYGVPLQDEVQRLQDNTSNFVTTTGELVNALTDVDKLNEELSKEQSQVDDLAHQQQSKNSEIAAMERRIESTHEDIGNTLSQASSIAASVP